jgi:hypothetical protein
MPAFSTEREEEKKRGLGLEGAGFGRNNRCIGAFFMDGVPSGAIMRSYARSCSPSLFGRVPGISSQIQSQSRQSGRRSVKAWFSWNGQRSSGIQTTCMPSEVNDGRKFRRALVRMDIADLTHSLAYGNTIADAAGLLCRDEDEVRQQAKELRLVEHPGKRVRGEV